MNILCVAAHPDDIEILCAGTLIKYSQQGHKVFMAIFSSGNMGDLKISPEDLSIIREKEARDAAAIIGATIIWPAIMDEHVFPCLEQRRTMIDILREADPDVIITHSPNDYHPDHRAVSTLVFDSYFQKGLPFIPGQKLPACRFGQSQLYYMDNLGGIDFNPSEYVDVGDVFELKKQMLACHKSQLESMKDMAYTNLLEMIEIQARFRGLAAGCNYAEGFKRLDAFQRGLTKRILP